MQHPLPRRSAIAIPGEAKQYNVAVDRRDRRRRAASSSRSPPSGGFPLKGLKLLATERSAGKRIPFGEGEIVVEVDRCVLLQGSGLRLHLGVGRGLARVRAGRPRRRCHRHRRLERLAPGPRGAACDPGGQRPPTSRRTRASSRFPTARPRRSCSASAPLHALNRVTRVVADTYQSVSGTGSGRSPNSRSSRAPGRAAANRRRASTRSRLPSTCSPRSAPSWKTATRRKSGR